MAKGDKGGSSWTSFEVSNPTTPRTWIMSLFCRRTSWNTERWNKQLISENKQASRWLLLPAYVSRSGGTRDTVPCLPISPSPWGLRGLWRLEVPMPQDIIMQNPPHFPSSWLWFCHQHDIGQVSLSPVIFPLIINNVMHVDFWHILQHLWLIPV